MSSSAMKMFVSGVHSSRKNVFHSRLVLVWLMAIFFVIIFFSLLWNRILHLLFGMSSVSFMSFLLKAFALLWRELDNVGFMGFLRVRMFTLNLVVVLFWQISCLENYVTKIYKSFFLGMQCPASLLTGGDKIKMYGGVIGQPVWPELFRMFVLFVDFLQVLSQSRSFSSAGDCQGDVCSRSFESLVGLQFIRGLLFSWKSDMRELFSSCRDLIF